MDESRTPFAPSPYRVSLRRLAKRRAVAAGLPHAPAGRGKSQARITPCVLAQAVLGPARARMSDPCVPAGLRARLHHRAVFEDEREIIGVAHLILAARFGVLARLRGGVGPGLRLPVGAVLRHAVGETLGLERKPDIRMFDKV
jgi:hypothetical protein